VGVAASGRATELLSALRERLAVISDLRGVRELLQFDQETVMPATGAAGRADQLATISGLVHEGLTDPALAELLDQAAELDLEGDDAALVRVARREVDRARRVPPELVRELARGGSLGHLGWARAREDDDFAAFLPHLERNVALRIEYAACFETDEPYDALIDDYEPGMRTEELRAAFAPLRAELPGLVAAAAEHARPPLRGPFDPDRQRRVVLTVLERVGFDEGSWVLGESSHPFSASPAPGDNRITTRFSEHNLDSISSALHEYGHGLYEAQVDPVLARSPLGHGASMGIHESQSRLWEIFVGQSVPFWRGAWPRLVEALGEPPDGLAPEEFVGALAAVRPSLIRVEADPVSYPLHIVLRFDLELAMLSGRLAPADVPGAWRDGMRELLGVEVPDDRRGVLQDVHWGHSSFGYFPSYALGTILAAQIWAAARTALPNLDADLEAGDLAPLREWLREHLHRHGRRMEPRDLLVAAIGSELAVEPYLEYARARAAAAD
jgi:carboxypeptidase Taq